MKRQMVSLLLDIGVAANNEVLNPKHVAETIGQQDLLLCDAELVGYHLVDLDSGEESGRVLYDVDGDPYVPQGEDGHDWDGEFRK